MSNAALGRAAVIVGLSASLLGAVGIAAGVLGRRPHLIRTARWYVVAVAGSAAVAVIAMERGLITRDFTMKYVAEHGSYRTPPLYNVAAMWSALEGSILLWAAILAGYTLTVAWRFRRTAADPLVGWAMVVLLAICAFFFGLMAGPANPFRSVVVPPTFIDGPGPNPLLQNHLLVAFHPPLLYLGYVGFSVPFAFAIAALATGRVGEGWLHQTRRWTLLAWGCLTAGIILGAWWSYEVLGWGGYWAWDPVENASFLPWLTGTAYLHSVMVQERRGMLRVWNLSLLCATFSLTILGTFLTRSGVVDSVHAFSESAIGPYLLTGFGVIVALSVGLIAWRGDRLRSPGRIDSPLSREAAFLANNAVLGAFALVVLLGTVFPLITEALKGDRLSIGQPYFDRFAAPIGLVLLLLMAVAPVLPWRSTTTEVLSTRLWWPAWGAVATLVVCFVAGVRGVQTLAGFALGAFAGGSALRQLVLATRRNGWRGLVGRTNGGMVVHLGVVVMAVALVAGGSSTRRGEFTVSEGDTVRVGGHEVTYRGFRLVETSRGPQYRFSIDVDGERFGPTVTRYEASGMVIGAPSVRVGASQDVFLSVPSPPETGSGSISLLVIVFPLVVWLWVGGMIMVAGSALAFVPGLRRPTDPASAVPSVGRRTEGVAP